MCYIYLTSFNLHLSGFIENDRTSEVLNEVEAWIEVDPFIIWK